MITVVSIEEQYSGRLAQIRKASSTETLVAAYERLKRTFIFLADLTALDYTPEADQLFRQFRSAGIRIGTQDLRIAAIVLAHDGILVTRNLRDFEQVPGVRTQDWSV